ncbi:MAG: hypothetical protein ACLQMF_10425 [Rectinemataceae bacterium]
MNRLLALIGIGLALSFTGCESMWKTMGVATVSSVNARNDKVDAELADLKTSVDALSVKMDDVQKAAAEVARIDALVNDLQTKINLLPQETLKKLADILNKAAAEAEAQSAQQP